MGATPPPLGEDTKGKVDPDQHQMAPFLVGKAMSEAVHSIAAEEGCDVLPLFECVVHQHEQLTRDPFQWTPAEFLQARESQRALRSTMAFENKTWIELEPESKRPALLHDLVHMNERGA